MKFNKLKVLTTLIIGILMLGVVGCYKSTETKENSNESKINFNISNGMTISYKKSELVDAYKDIYGENLEKMTEDKASLENFIKNEIYCELKG